MEEHVSSGQTFGMIFIPQMAFPELFSFTNNKSISVAEVRSRDLQNIFHLPLSEEAYTKFLHLQQLLGVLQSTDDKDKWEFIWGSTHFSSSRTYRHLNGHSQVHAAYRWNWRSSFQNKHRARGLQLCALQCTS